MSIGDILKKLQKEILFLLFILVLLLTFLSVRKAIATSNRASFVYIDVGHGGFDGGATSLDGTILEKDVTLEVATYVANYLTKTGIKVKMTRTTDKALAQNKKEDMHKRVNLINESTCDIYVSIHANAYSASSIKGAQTFYNSFNLENEQFATTIMKYLQLIDSDNKRVAKNITGKYLLDYTKKVGCIVEIGFLTNPFDLELLTNKEKKEALAKMIYLGILDYLEEKNHERSSIENK